MEENKKTCGIRPCNTHFTHVGNIKHTARSSHGIMLFNYSGIFNRHNESAERTHSGPENGIYG